MQARRLINYERSDLITAAQLANYVVCPEAWRLKYIGVAQSREVERPQMAKELRRDWVEKQELSSQLRRYARIAYILLFMLAVIVFLLEQKRSAFSFGESRPRAVQDAAADQSTQEESPIWSSQTVPTELALLMLVLGLIIFMWDLFDRRSTSIRRDGGLSDRAEPLSLKGSDHLPGVEYMSERLALASKPDAIVREEGAIIPVDIHPFSKKVRDRHVIPLIVHLRLIEEREGTAPPYGLLLMGRARRPVRIKNTPDKQQRLDALIDEMRSIMDGIPAVPAPAPFKCKHCDVQSVCAFRADLIGIGEREDAAES